MTRTIACLCVALASVLVGALTLLAFQDGKAGDVVAELKVKRITFVSDGGETIGTLGPAPEGAQGAPGLCFRFGDQSLCTAALVQGNGATMFQLSDSKDSKSSAAFTVALLPGGTGYVNLHTFGFGPSIDMKLNADGTVAIDENNKK